MSGVVVKVLRGTAKVALAVLAAVALLIGVTWMFLQTRRGGELVRRLALPRVNAAIAGTITLSRFAFGGDRITLEDVALTDPEGHPVASVEQIDVSFSPLALLRRHVDVTRLEIRRPELALVRDERGLNLARALAPRHPPAAAPGEPARAANGGPRIAIDVRSLVVSDGEIDYRAMAAASGGRDAGQHVRVADVAIRSSAHFAAGRLAAEAGVSVRGGRAALNGAFDTAARRGHAAAQVSVRGASLAVEGRLDGDAVDAHASIEAEDLARAARVLTRDFGLPRLAISGNGRVDVACGGAVAAPSLRAAVRFPRLAFGGTSARELTASARIPDLRVPEALDADVGAAAIDGGGRKLRAAKVTLRAAGRRITAQAAIAAPQRLRIDLAGERQARRTIALDALTVRYPEATWTLRRRARLELAGGAVALSGFELGADAQRLSAEVRAGGARRTAHVKIAHLDLSRLPPALVPRDVGLGGSVDAELDLRADRGEAPRVVARATLAGGRVHGHRDLSLNVAARLERGRAKGDLQARGLGVAAQARFDLPAAWPPRNARAPLALTVETGDVDLAAVARAVAETAGTPPPRLAGHGRVTLRLDGRVGEPRLQIDVSGRGLVFDDRRIGDLALSVNGEGDGGLSARITSLAPARTRIDVTTPLSLRAILRRPPTAEALARTRFELRGTIERLPLSVLARAAGGAAPAHVRGTLSSTLSVTGTPSEPQGKIAVDVAGAATDRFPPTDARVEADFERGAVAARVRVVRRDQPLLAVETRLGAPLGELARPARLAAAPVHLRAVLGPYLVQRLGLPPLNDREPPRQLAGRVHADVAVDGTVGAPRVLLHAQAGDIRLDKTDVGFAEIEARYADRHAQLDAHLTSAGGGKLTAQASMSADLGYPAVARGADLRRAPIDARLNAQRFDLRGASGAVQALRTVGGLLTASVTARGLLAAPRFSGRLEVTDGAVVVSGFGAYSKVHLALHGDERTVTLDELSARSGAGTVRLTGRAVRAASGSGYDVAADARLDKFPFYSQGQPLAIVSLESRLNGGAAPGKTRLSVDIDDAHVELKDAKHKDLQSLEAPADIVLVEAGTPLNKAQEAKLKALLKADQAQAAPVGAHHPPALRVRVNAPRHLWVNGRDANLELGLSRDFKVSVGDRTEIHGQVTVHRGRVDVLGRRFDIKEDSTVTFAGAPDNPVLDVRAEHLNTTENITVLVTAKGTPDHLSVSVTSPNRPDLGESQLYTLIITGHLQFGGAGATSATPSAQAASILGGLLASKIQSTLAHRLPLDVFTIDVGGEGVSGTKLEAGRYITDRLYAGYIGRVGSDPTRYQNRNAVHLEYQITSRWEIEGEYGDLGTGTADLIWRKNY
ncbi:MAG TPA: translocation/assembly module TamB domain-containing protein [Polyangia bacterium]